MGRGAAPTAASFEVNGRRYDLPARPVVVVCVDGCEDDYLTAAIARGLMPNVQRMYRDGFRGVARCVLPSFTNPNNASIVTGVPPSAHGIPGNFFLDPDEGEVMMNSRRFLRAGTVLRAAEAAGRRVAVGTAKHKLHGILSADLSAGRSLWWSVERTAEAEAAAHGISAADLRRLYRGAGDGADPQVPSIYSSEASLFLLRAGAGLVEEGRADFLYLSTTDYIQHKHAPSDPVALALYEGFDREIGRMLAAGAAVGITADHGMNDKQRPDGSPAVLYLSDFLTAECGVAEGDATVLLPITDPYVRHHGSLGGYAAVHLRGAAARRAAELRGRLLAEPGVSECYLRGEAAAKLQLPADRTADLICLAARHVCLGKRPADHELAEVATGLRSHGSRYEECVPFVLSAPLRPEYAQRARCDLRNFDIFAAVTTWAQHRPAPRL